MAWTWALRVPSGASGQPSPRASADTVRGECPLGLCGLGCMTAYGAAPTANHLWGGRACLAAPHAHAGDAVCSAAMHIQHGRAATAAGGQAGGQAGHPAAKSVYSSLSHLEHDACKGPVADHVERHAQHQLVEHSADKKYHEHGAEPAVNAQEGAGSKHEWIIRVYVVWFVFGRTEGNGGTAVGGGGRGWGWGWGRGEAAGAATDGATWRSLPQPTLRRAHMARGRNEGTRQEGRGGKQGAQLCPRAAACSAMGPLWQQLAATSRYPGRNTPLLHLPDNAPHIPPTPAAGSAMGGLSRWLDQMLSPPGAARTQR